MNSEENKEESKKKQDSSNQEPSIPLSQVEKMIEEKLKSSRDDKIAKALERLGNANDTPQYQEEEDGYMQERDPDDLLPEKEAVIFYSHSYCYVIVDAKRPDGYEKAPTSGPIKFELFDSKIVQKGDEAHVHQLCRYKTRSKKVAAWLRSHPLFGITFREYDHDAENNLEKSEHLIIAANLMQSYSNMEPDQVVAQAESNGLTILEDINKLRRNLVLHLAKQKIEQIKQGQAEQNKVNLLTAKEEAPSKS